MVRVESSIEIKAPIEKVFAFLADPRNYEKIFADSKVKMEMLSEGPIGLGTKYRISAERRRILGGQQVDFHLHEYVEFEENHTFTDRETEGRLKKEEMTFIFDKTDNGTKVIAIIDYELPYSGFGIIIGKLMRVKMAFIHFLRSSLERAKETLETQA
ncbi:MAG: SRPBCC family protein [Candidatus Bathyarchaeota archaeon]|nr:MAG: SRPBCC family protein [Candidatus Bathyarchaeota archaeon]